MRQRFWLGTAALVVILVRPAAGQFDIGDYSRILEQIDRNTRLMAHTEVPVGQRALLRYGGTLSFDFLAFDDTNQKTHVLRQTTMTGHAQLNLDGAHEFFLRARTSYLDWNTGDSFGESGPFDARTDHGDDWVEPTLDRGHYRFDLRRALQAYEGRTIDGNLVIQGGRQLVHWANGLVLSQEIDGGEITVSIGPWTLETVAGRTRESTTDIDSSRPGYSGDTKRGFYGGMLSYALTPRHRPFVYGLVQQDDNTSDTVVTDANGTPGDPTDDIVTRFDYDSWYVGAGATGSLGDRIAYGVEIVYQGGEGLSNSLGLPPPGGGPATQLVQTREDIEAFAADIRIEYLFADENRTRLGFEMILASGDDDRLTTTNTIGGNLSGTDDDAFNAFGLLNTGLAYFPNVSNLVVLRVGASTYPFPSSPLFRRLQVGTNLFLYGKLDADAPTNEDFGVVDDERYLGFEPDLYVNWQVASDLAVVLRYGVFIPGDAVTADHDERHFFFSGVTIAF